MMNSIAGNIKFFIQFLVDLYASRSLIIELTKQDFTAKYLGSYLGLLWAFIQPTITILIFWFVFQFGFKTQPVKDIPFVLWLVAGIIPWFFITDALVNAASSVIEKAYLVQKVVFRVSILPIVKICAALLIHLFFVCVLLLMFLGYGYPLHVYMLQIPYYLFAMIVLLVGTSWLTSSLMIFLRDLGQVIGMFLQFGFWLTPIFWSPAALPAKYRFLIQANPAYYVVEGYRNSFIFKVWFWEHWIWTLYFWVLTGSIFVLGALVFRRLRPHFADVL